MIRYNPVTDNYVEYMEKLFPQYKSVDTQEELKNIFPLVDDIESFSDNIPNWVQKIQNGEFFIGNNWTIEKNPSYEEKEKKEQQIPDPDVPINEEWAKKYIPDLEPDAQKSSEQSNQQKPNQQKPNQQKPIQQEPITQQAEPSKTKSNQKNTQQSTSIGENRYNKSPLYEWDGKSYLTKEQKSKLPGMMNIYRSLGIPSHIAAAILGHICVESRDLDTQSVNPNDVGQVSTGLIQWDPSRLKQLKKYAESKNKSWGDVSVQLEFILHEMKTNRVYKKYYDSLMSSSTPAEAVEAMAGYISFAGYDGTLNTTRNFQRDQKMSDAQLKAWIEKQHKKRQYYAQEIYRNWGY